MDGVTWVAVSATARRRGALRAMMDRLLHDARERGVPVLGLGASESSIYRRFGYGVASHIGTRGDRHRARRAARPVRATPAGCASTRSTDAMPGVARRREPAGGPRRRHPAQREPVARDGRQERQAGRADRTDGGRRPRGQRRRCGRVRQLPAGAALEGRARRRRRARQRADRAQPRRAPGAVAARAHHGPRRARRDVEVRARRSHPVTSSPTRAGCASASGTTCTCASSTWSALLQARRYAREDALVIEVRDDAVRRRRRPVPASTAASTARPRRATDAQPDIALDAAGLGSVLLGDVSVAALHRAGIVEELTDGAVRRASAMFGWSPRPWVNFTVLRPRPPLRVAPRTRAAARRAPRCRPRRARRR